MTEQERQEIENLLNICNWRQGVTSLPSFFLEV